MFQLLFTKVYQIAVSISSLIERRKRSALNLENKTLKNQQCFK